ncbi:hypothetical protein DIPPA_35913 [Diplonema papillatum]|nr:hypothetical protein DIPPA_35913 [Diplonema papillatum]
MFSMRAYARGSLSHASKSEHRILYGRANSGSIRWAFARMVSTAVTFLDGCFVPKAPFTTRDRSPLAAPRYPALYERRRRDDTDSDGGEDPRCAHVCRERSGGTYQRRASEGP